MGEMTVGELAELILDAAGEAAADKLAAALHMIVVSATDVYAAFNSIVERQQFNDELRKLGLRRAPLSRLATKNEFGAN